MLSIRVIILALHFLSNIAPCAAQNPLDVSKATMNAAKKHPILSQPAARMNVFPNLKFLTPARCSVPKAAVGRQRVYTLSQQSASRDGKIFRLSRGMEHGIVSPPGNRDTTEFPDHELRDRCTSARSTGK